MSEYIEKNVAIARLTALEIGNPCATMTDAKRQIADTRPADVAPVVHGRWVQKKEWHLGRWVAWFECSECGEHDDNSDMYEMMPFCNLSNYCPGCGAKMDGDDSDAVD